MNEDQQAAWHAALARKAKVGRARRGKRSKGLGTVTGPGMVRVMPRSRFAKKG